MNKAAIIAFVTGAAAGAAGAYYYLNKKFEKRLEEETESVKASFGKAFSETIHSVNKESEKRPASDNQTIINVTGTGNMGKVQEAYSQYAKTIEHYTNYATPTPKESSKVSMEESDIEYITPDDFGMIDDYEECFYTFYNDGVMIEGSIRNDDMIIEDPFDLIGDKDEFTPHVGEHEEITLLGMNNRLREYFEVTFVDEPYNEEE